MRNLENPISQEIIMEREKFRIEIEEYKELLNKLEAVIKIETENPKVSLAFLVEEIKNKNPKGWQNDLKKLKERIDRVAEQEGKAGVTWVMSEVISSAYIEFLERRKQEVQDESLKRKLEIFKKMAEQSLEFNRKLHEQGQPGAFGGVSLDYVPKWYYYQKYY